MLGLRDALPLPGETVSGCMLDERSHLGLSPFSPAPPVPALTLGHL